MDLLKVYNCILHEILIAKLECHGLDGIILKLILNYPSHRKQKIKIGLSFSSCFGIYIGVAQGSILWSLLFNLFINDLFINVVKSEICNFADGNTLYSFDKTLDTIFSSLKYKISKKMQWFQLSSLKGNLSKFQFMIFGNKQYTSFVLVLMEKILKTQWQIWDIL